MHIQFTWRSAAAVSAALLSMAAFAAPLMAFAQAAPEQPAAAAIDAHDSAQVEARVRQYFADLPQMPAIAQCESGFRQYGPNGLVLFDPSYSMVGVFQISAAHMPQALSMGMDITTLEGNMAYARYLYSVDGIDPWMSSFGCWGSMVPATASPAVLGTSTSATPAAPAAPAPAAAASNIRFSLGDSSPTVLAVQQMLNKIGVAVAASGPGSPGNETTMFGSLTRAALRRFQCAQNIACQGDESTTGYGLLDDRTYQALVAAVNALAPAAAAASGPVIAPPAATSTSSADKAAQAAQIRSQITLLQNQIDALNQELGALAQ